MPARKGRAGIFYSSSTDGDGILIEEENKREWTVRETYRWIESFLGRKGDSNPQLSAQWLLSAATGATRVQLFMDFDRVLTEGERACLRGFVSRRAQGEPLQYITEESSFRFITLKIAPGALIPRPETEELVSAAWELLPPLQRRSAVFTNNPDPGQVKAYKNALRSDWEAGYLALADTDASAASAQAQAQALQDFLSEEDAPDRVFAGSSHFDELMPDDSPYYLLADIGTGSGCIACSLASERQDCRVVASDISSEALALARQNVHDLGLEKRVALYQGDLGGAIPQGFVGRFDAILSNPPYIPTALLASLEKEVSCFEPALALDGGEDGLDVYRRLLPWALQACKPGGYLLVELHEECLQTAVELALQSGFAEAQYRNDLAGKPRIVICRKGC